MQLLSQFNIFFYDVEFMDKKLKPEKSGKFKTNFQTIAGFFIAAFMTGSVLSLSIVTIGLRYQCFDTIKNVSVMGRTRIAIQ